MKRHASHILAFAVAGLPLQGCQDQATPTGSHVGGALVASVTPVDPAGRHLVVFTAERVPADFGERVSRLGGSVETALDNLGAAAVTGLSQSGVAELVGGPGIRAVEPDGDTLAVAVN